MAKKVKTAAPEVVPGRIPLGTLLSETRPKLDHFGLWLVGDTPLIVHAWSEKAKMEMLGKQVGSVRVSRDKRDPKSDFINSLYAMEEGVYGFPITAIKKAVWSCAHKDRGIARTDVQSSLWLDAQMVRVRPAHPRAVCDLPLVRIYGSDPEMREDMVRIGSGLKKTANLSYRAQFTVWAIRVTGSTNPQIVSVETLMFLFHQAGPAIGIGDWRNEKGGWAGAFHPGKPEECDLWNAFAAGTGPLPKPVQAVRKVVDPKAKKAVHLTKRENNDAVTV